MHAIHDAGGGPPADPGPAEARDGGLQSRRGIMSPQGTLITPPSMGREAQTEPIVGSAARGVTGLAGVQSVSPPRMSLQDRREFLVRFVTRQFTEDRKSV